MVDGRDLIFPALCLIGNSGVGVGFSIVVKDNTRVSQIIVANTTLSNNSASFGGWLMIALCENATKHEVIATHFSTGVNTCPLFLMEQTGLVRHYQSSSKILC